MKFDPALPVAVFLGPSLDHETAAQVLPANYYPPVRMGDVYRLMTCGVRLIVIVDGVFHGTAPVWQREIVAALNTGVHVIGASSMGALRAIELAPAGMIGLGTIVDWYRNGEIEGDDEVALMHADAEYGYRALSEPLVNIRWNLARAGQAGVIGAEAVRELTDAMQALDHASRSYQALYESDAFARLDAGVADALRVFLTSSAENLKRADALHALSWCAERLPRLLEARPASPRGGRRIERLNELLLRGVPAGDGSLPTVHELLVSAAGDHARTAHIVNHASRRFYLLEWARAAGVAPMPQVVQAFVDRWAADHDVTDRAAWLAANAITAEELDRELTERAAASWLLDRGPSACGLDRPFLEAWAALAGVDPPDDRESSEAFRAWLVEKTPNYFGFDQWSADAAFARELQITGEMARLAAAWRAPDCAMEDADAGARAV